MINVKLKLTFNRNSVLFYFQGKFGRSMSSINLPSLRLPSGAKFWKKRSANISEYDPTFRAIYLGNVLTSWAKGKPAFIRNISIKRSCLSPSDSNTFQHNMCNLSGLIKNICANFYIPLSTGSTVVRELLEGGT